MTNNNSPKLPDAYHPNAVELHVTEAQNAALNSLGLSDKVQQQGMEALSTEEAAEVAQATVERLDAFQSNVNMMSE
ncbi:MAG: hypothetical protein WCC10_01170 [Tumebacillaceae bacterium]